MDESVGDGASGVVEELSPIFEGQVGGDDGGGSLVALVEDLVEQVGAAGVEGEVSELVDEQEVVRGPGRESTREGIARLRGDQFVDQVSSEGESHPIAAEAGKGLARTKTRAGRRQVPIEPALMPLLRLLVKDAPAGAPLLRVPPPEDCAELVRKDLLAAGCDREELFADGGERHHFTFHGLRHTALTHWAVAERPLQWLLVAAGHTNFDVTQRYIDAAVMLKGTFGQPHPPLPPSLLEDAESELWRNYQKDEGKLLISLRPQRELNPCYRRERPMS